LPADKNQTDDESSVSLISKPECWDLKQLKYFSEAEASPLAFL